VLFDLAGRQVALAQREWSHQAVDGIDGSQRFDTAADPRRRARPPRPRPRHQRVRGRRRRPPRWLCRRRGRRADTTSLTPNGSAARSGTN